MDNFGRPTKYKTEFCEKLIKHMEGGNSFPSFAAAIDVSIDTIYQWVKQHDDFSESKKIGLAKLLAYDEKIAKAGSTGQLSRKARKITKTKTLEDGSVQVTEEEIYEAATFSQTYQIFLMKNRYPKIYRDKIEVETKDSRDPAKLAKAFKEVLNDPKLTDAARALAEKLSEE